MTKYVFWDTLPGNGTNISHQNGKRKIIDSKKVPGTVVGDMWVFPQMVVPPKHPKMIILVGTPMVFGYHHSRKPPCDCSQEGKLFFFVLQQLHHGVSIEKRPRN